MECSIEHLEADNYSSWRTDMKVLLMERNCWRIVTGTETKPEDENYKELRDFNSRKDKAYSTIYLKVSKAYRCVIDDIEDPVAAWKRLEEHFKPNSRAHVIGLTNDFFSCRMNPQEEIGVYAARIRSIVDQLKDAGKPISEWYQAFQLIRFLPPEFNGIVQYIYRWDDNEFKFDKILQELIAEESRLKQSIKDQNETCAFQSIERNNISKTPRSKSKQSSFKKNIQPTRKNTKVMKSPNTFIAESNLSQGYERDSWILDTAATSHFCSKKNFFPELQTSKEFYNVCGCWWSTLRHKRNWNRKDDFRKQRGHKPSVKHLKAFGSTAYSGVPKQLRKKFDMRAEKGIMVGYALKTRGYRIWLPNERKIVETINVSFDEDNMLEPNSSGAVLDPNKKTINV
ncbi:hypothetical protein AVEN_147108-1 [Araneus ventricosus]|uniref:Retroviral polymerase SH3-like domain-containing protein n=1 Tax=Araneus ventricosus TaxID=182803 RepID=A0A4Y2VTK4_ARAVE|nr:hypothetical protein AVEN_98857-1 [Araneus ventricosus]GBO28011.1 hypothetical protein AVEN_147108-1 [Araneus ventricosus]